MRDDLQFYSEFSKKLDKIRSEINEIVWHKAKVFCITERFATCSKYAPQLSNYNWCPIGLNFKNERGSQFDRVIKEGYLSYVKEWSNFLDSESGVSDTYNLQKGDEVKTVCNNLLCNRADKPVAFSIEFREYELYPKRFHISNKILFLPQTTKIDISKGIDCLIEEILCIPKQEINLPSWTEKVQLVNEAELVKKIGESEDILKSTKENLEKYRKELDSLTRFKGLLTADGDTLVALIDEAFVLFGIKLEPVEGYKEDRIFSHKGDKIPIEVKGLKGSIPLKGGLQQLISRLDREDPRNYKAHGVLIGNHYKETPLDGKLNGRSVPFEPNVIEQAKSWKCCLISTLEIFEFVDKKLSGEDVNEEFRNRVFNTIGIGK